jgi:O-antigen biosynthesis protein
MDERRIALSIDVADGTTFRPSAATMPADGALDVLIRFHGYPLGALTVPAAERDRLLTRAREYAWTHLREELVQHLVADGATAVDRVDVLEQPFTCRQSLGRAPCESPLVTVAVATVANDDGCVRTVRKILESEYSNVEVVVVDNSRRPSAGLEPRLAAEFAGRAVRYAHEPRAGLSFARNRGAREARGAIIVFTDDDVVPDPTWLPAIVRTFSRFPLAACVTGAILPIAIETPAQAWLEQYGGYNKGFREEVFDLRDNARRTPLYPYDSGQFGSGANIAIRADHLRRIGPFAVALGAGTPAHGGEDLDMLRRVVTSGAQLVYQPAALLWHQHPDAYSSLRKKMFRYGVGLSATVTKWCLESPATALAIAGRLPAGVRHVFGSGSRKNRGKSAQFPRELTWLERAGILAGPVLYLKSRVVTGSRASRFPSA